MRPGALQILTGTRNWLPDLLNGEAELDLTEQTLLKCPVLLSTARAHSQAGAKKSSGSLQHCAAPFMTSAAPQRA